MATSVDRPFLVHAAALRKTPGVTRHEARHGVIQGLGSVGVVVPEGAEVGADVTLSSYPGGVMASGTVTAPWLGECRRCGGPVAGAVEAVVTERFVVAGSTAEAEDPDGDAYRFADDLLDLEPLARDAVLLALPLAPLCSPDCRGRCPRCGADRNLETCSCEAPTDPRWAALDQLRDVDGEGLA